ncbi:MAG: hypothetical protein IK115_08215 [Lachnospiraceae bacterium]|nr:hypothetical protein [Lachnospiraceae bacterium]
MDEKNGQVDPALLAFLDADSLSDKLEVLSRYGAELTARSLTSIEMSLGMETSEEDTDVRLRRIKGNLETREKYERGRR